MSAQERQRLREDLRETYREREPTDRQRRSRQLSAHELETLRGDVLDANAELQHKALRKK